MTGIVRSAGAVAGVVLLEVLEDPRVRRSIARAARTVAGRLAARRPARPVVPAPSGGAVLVRRVETAIVVYRRVSPSPPPS